MDITVKRVIEQEETLGVTWLCL